MTLFFTKNKASTKPAARPRVVRFSPTEGQGHVKDPRVALALNLRAPSPFPHPRALKKFIAGRLGKSSTKIATPKLRPVDSRRTRQFLIPKGTPGVEDESATGTEREEEDARRRKTNQYYFSRAARYIRKAHFQSGDRVLVNVTTDDDRSTWRHGVVPDLRQNPRSVIGADRYLYPATYELNGQTRTERFDPHNCSILYDTLLSKSNTDE
ncbi:hypothetical protein GY45DRAFT_1067494 [Cubamyces sp. BRFM 1775]|nr:hypothetical protein GY45DRAFT_1067494 [Cubamyces sp. BRFM 1775]